jgi:hypothetical protein
LKRWPVIRTRAVAMPLREKLFDVFQQLRDDAIVAR